MGGVEIAENVAGGDHALGGRDDQPLGVGRDGEGDLKLFGAVVGQRRAGQIQALLCLIETPEAEGPGLDVAHEDLGRAGGAVDGLLAGEGAQVRIVGVDDGVVAGVVWIRDGEGDLIDRCAGAHEVVGHPEVAPELLESEGGFAFHVVVVRDAHRTAGDVEVGAHHGAEHDGAQGHGDEQFDDGHAAAGVRIHGEEAPWVVAK